MRKVVVCSVFIPAWVLACVLTGTGAVCIGSVCDMVCAPPTGCEPECVGYVPVNHTCELTRVAGTCTSVFVYGVGCDVTCSGELFSAECTDGSTLTPDCETVCAPGSLAANTCCGDSFDARAC